MHVGFIMDGNGRWATSQGLSRLEGHTKGEEILHKIILACSKRSEITHATFYALSLQNWKREKKEIDHILDLALKFVEKIRSWILENTIRFKAVGILKHLPLVLHDALVKLEKDTESASGMTLSMCFSYGGREEIVEAIRSMDPTTIHAIGVQDITDALSLPDVDLVIRTSGELRTSNFLLWQSAYAEYSFTKTLWPDFTEEELYSILDEYTTRNRTFGTTAADLEKTVPSVEEKYEFLKELFEDYKETIDHSELYESLLKEGYKIDTIVSETKDRGVKDYVLCSNACFDLSVQIDDIVDVMPMELQVKNLKSLYTDFSVETLNHILKDTVISQKISEVYSNISALEKIYLQRIYECEYLQRVSTNLQDKAIYRFLSNYYLMILYLKDLYSDDLLLLYGILISFIDDSGDEDTDAIELRYITPETNIIISNAIKDAWNMMEKSVYRKPFGFICISVLINRFYRPVPIPSSANHFMKFVFEFEPNKT